MRRLTALAAVALASASLAGCGGSSSTSLADLAEGVPADAAAWLALDLRDGRAKAFARRVVGADPPDVDRVAIWVRFRRDGSPETRLITTMPRKTGGLAAKQAFRDLIGDVPGNARAAGYYDPARLTRAAAIRSGLDPGGIEALLRTRGAQPAGGVGTLPRDDGRALVLDVRSAACFTRQARFAPVTTSPAWALARVPAPGLGQTGCGAAAAPPPARVKLPFGALDLDRDLLPWGRIDTIALSPGGEVALGGELTDRAKERATLQRLRRRPGAAYTQDRSLAKANAESRRLVLPPARAGGRATRIEGGIARAVLRLVSADGPAKAVTSRAADVAALTSLMGPGGAGTILRGSPLGFEDALAGLAADPDDEHRARVVLLAP